MSVRLPGLTGERKDAHLRFESSPVFVPLGVMPFPKIHVQVALNVG